MRKERLNPNLAQISLLVPKLFLRRFDEAIEDIFPSRSEAIRRGMNLVLKEAQRSSLEEPERLDLKEVELDG